ncbi:hypothetical protein NliqN6_0412 [Naganishia liquefaciens]|uniref:GATA-type domain-containing protein n=1 Tax=Naganishia liquefaciens TaxID=104408 RepID=A0A8H3YC80_9TREE|nr:hypothetical protein NliqN6_0412 [Naganishia liquefaciens]
MCEPETMEIKATYDQLLGCLSSLVPWSQEIDSCPRDIFHTCSRQEPTMVDRASVHRLALEGLATFAHQGIARVAFAQAASEESDSQASGSTPLSAHMERQREISFVSTDHTSKPYDVGNAFHLHIRREHRSKHFHQSPPFEMYSGYPEPSTVTTSTFSDISSTLFDNLPSSEPDDQLTMKSSLEAQCPIGCIAMDTTNQKSQPLAQRETFSHHPATQAGNLVRCLNCDKRETPEWRKGPYGPRTLCNACGLVWAKIQKRRAKDASAVVKTALMTNCKHSTLLVRRQGS